MTASYGVSASVVVTTFLAIDSFGRAHIITGEESGAVTVPSSALLPLEDGGLGVATVEAGKVHTLPVTVLSEEAGQAVVTGALKGGESAGPDDHYVVGAHYYVFERGRFKQVYFVHKPPHEGATNR